MSVLISGHDKKGTFAKKHRTSRRGTRAHRRAQRTYARTSDHTVRHPRSVGWEVNMCHLETRGEEVIRPLYTTLPLLPPLLPLTTTPLSHPHRGAHQAHARSSRAASRRCSRRASRACRRCFIHPPVATFHRLRGRSPTKCPCKRLAPCWRSSGAHGEEATQSRHCKGVCRHTRAAPQDGQAAHGERRDHGHSSDELGDETKPNQVLGFSGCEQLTFGLLGGRLAD